MVRCVAGTVLIAVVSGAMALSVMAFTDDRPLQNDTSAQQVVAGEPPRPASGAPDTGNLPPIELRPGTIDLGTIGPNETVIGRTVIQNVSDKPLRIVASRASCSCTSVNLPNVTLAPGESVPLEAQYKSTAGLGVKNAAVRVLFEGYDLIEIPIHVLIALPMRAEPAFISALPDQDGRPHLLGEYEVYSADEKPFRILAVDGGPVPYLDFDPQKDEPRNRYRLRWDFTGYDAHTCRNANGRQLQPVIVVETDHPECPVFDLEVRHECVRRRIAQTDTWALQERRILMEGVAPGETREYEVTAKWLPRQRPGDIVQAAVSESDQFSVELAEVKRVADGFICTLRITPSPGHQGLIYGTVRLHSSRQSAPLLIIGKAV